MPNLLGTILKTILFMMIGGFFLGSWGILLGAMVGFMSGMNSERVRVSRSDDYFRVTFRMMGHMAKADGRVSEQEIACARQAMHSFGLDPVQRDRAIGYFRDGAQEGVDLAAELREVAQICRRDARLAAMFVEIQIALACADGEFSPPEQEIVRACCAALGFSEEQAQVMVDRHLGGNGYAGNGHAGGGTMAGGQELEQAYGLLEVEASASMEEVQRAYGRKMKDFHPDKLASKGLPKEFMDFATEQTKQFTKAYQTIKQARR